MTRPHRLVRCGWPCGCDSAPQGIFVSWAGRGAVRQNCLFQAKGGQESLAVVKFALADGLFPPKTPDAVRRNSLSHRPPRAVLKRDGRCREIESVWTRGGIRK